MLAMEAEGEVRRGCFPAAAGADLDGTTDLDSVQVDELTEQRPSFVAIPH
jgi:hypothetical protein